MDRRLDIHLVAGARPNFMKIAPLYHELKRREWCMPVLVHTGQHYDADMSDVFFRDLNMPAPDHSLGVGAGTHAEQLGRIVIAYEKLLAEKKPDIVTVVGDVNGTAACALAAKKLNIAVAHVEAGLRSRDRSMPEEINRVVTDAISDLHFTPSRDADENLRAEGVEEASIRFVGNIMIDCLVASEPAIRKIKHPIPQIAGRPYALVTFHRPPNVDVPAALGEVVEGVSALSRRMPVIFPTHPRTRQRLQSFGFLDRLSRDKNIILTDPLGYADFMRCLFDASLVVTDSGGVQEETTYLGIACFTVRSTTERPITVSQGTNRLISAAEIMNAKPLEGRVSPRPELWDGKTAPRIAEAFKRYADAGMPLRQR